MDALIDTLWDVVKTVLLVILLIVVLIALAGAWDIFLTLLQNKHKRR